jgi:diamine N-acetyltransferase
MSTPVALAVQAGPFDCMASCLVTLAAAMSQALPVTEKLTIREANDRDLPAVNDLATAIFRQYYPSVISAAQIEYMLTRNYSLDSLRRQRQEGHVFLLGTIDNQLSAFASFSVSQEDTHEAQIHKLYVRAELHGKRIGVRLINEVTNRVLRMDRQWLILTVNRRNIQAINFYFREGFTIRSAVDLDIGGGFAMTDFVMEKEIGEAQRRPTGSYTAVNQQS